MLLQSRKEWPPLDGVTERASGQDWEWLRGEPARRGSVFFASSHRERREDLGVCWGWWVWRPDEEGAILPCTEVVGLAHEWTHLALFSSLKAQRAGLTLWGLYQSWRRSFVSILSTTFLEMETDFKCVSVWPREEKPRKDVVSPGLWSRCQAHCPWCPVVAWEAVSVPSVYIFMQTLVDHLAGLLEGIFPLILKFHKDDWNFWPKNTYSSLGRLV